MATITYNRTFSHTDWQDNVSRVQAGGADGFNRRFHDLENEFDTLQSVVSQINAALAALGQAPAPQTLRTTLTPMLVAITTTPWTHTQGQASKPAGATAAHGMMSVDLPHGVRVQTLRATGRNQNPSASLRITLMRQRITTDNAPAERLARVEASADPFDNSVAADSAFATVDTQQFKYFILAQLDNAQAADTVILTAFQITYSTS